MYVYGLLVLAFNCSIHWPALTSVPNRLVNNAKTLRAFTVAWLSVFTSKPMTSISPLAAMMHIWSQALDF